MKRRPKKTYSHFSNHFDIIDRFMATDFVLIYKLRIQNAGHLMKQPTSLLVLTIFSGLLLSSCAPFKYSDKRAAVCNQLNSKMIFNGSTSNARTADIQNAEEPLDQRTYENNHCDK